MCTQRGEKRKGDASAGLVLALRIVAQVGYCSGQKGQPGAFRFPIALGGGGILCPFRDALCPRLLCLILGLMSVLYDLPNFHIPDGARVVAENAVRPNRPTEKKGPLVGRPVGYGVTSV